MASARVTWVKKGQFIGVDSSKHAVVMSTQDAENAVGMKPSELLLVGLAGCTAIDIVNIMAKQRQSLSGLEIEIAGEQDSDPPWTYRKIHVRYKLRGEGLTEQMAERAIRLSEEKYCSVSASLKERVEVESSFELLPAA